MNSDRLGGVIASIEKLLHATLERDDKDRFAATIVILSTVLGDRDIAREHLVSAVDDPVLGAMAVRTYYFYTGDWQGTKPALKRLTSLFKKSSTSLIRSTDPERSEIAFGQPGSPLRLEEGDFYALDATIFKLIALETVVDILKTKDYEKSERFKKMYTELKNRAEITLYNEEMGLYMNRMRSGEWSKMYGIGSMLAPLAGLTYDFSRLENVILSLKSEKRFSAVNGVPSLPRSNYFFNRTFFDFNGVKSDGFESYAGMISPSFNYLVYMGLLRMGATADARELASKCLKAFLTEESRFKYPEYYMPDWQKTTARDVNNLNAALMAVLSIIDVININVFGEGLSIGSYGEDITLEGIVIDGRDFTLSRLDGRTVLYMAEEPRFVFTAPVTVFGYRESSNAISFSVSTATDYDFYLKYPLARKTGTHAVSAAGKAGKSFIRIDRTSGAVSVIKFA